MILSSGTIVEMTPGQRAERPEVGEIGFRQEDLVVLLRREIRDLRDLARERGVEDELIHTRPTGNGSAARANINKPDRATRPVIERVAAEEDAARDLAGIDDEPIEKDATVDRSGIS